jgi:hypothetical protein
MAKRKSRKARVKDLFEKQGIQAAWTLGLKLGLKQSSLRVWFSRWHHAKPVKQAPPINLHQSSDATQ